jgi:hypothetical protein
VAQDAVLYSSAVEPYYIACWVSGEKVERCGHKHLTIGDAEDCRWEIMGRFIRAVESDGERSMSDEEFEIWRLLEKRVSPSTPCVRCGSS